MKILIVGYMHSKFDKRVYRTVETLRKVAYIIYQYWTDDPNENPYCENNIKFLPIYYLKNRGGSILERISRRRKLDRRILTIIEKEDYDILYLHDFLASFPVRSFKIAKRMGKKVIYDIHEYHPQSFLANLKGLKKLLKEKLMFHILKKQIFFSDKLIFVSPDTAEDILKTLNIRKEYLVIPNYASSTITSSEKNKEIVLVGKTKRTLYEEKEILKELSKYGFKFRIIGMDSKSFKDLEIEYECTGFLPYDKMIKEISKAAFSMISYKTTVDPNYKNDIFALPNKYYDSLAAETPVIVNKRFATMAREVEKLGAGIIIDTSKPKAAAEKILEAYENYDKLIANIRKYKDRFVWTKDKEDEFIDFVCK